VLNAAIINNCNLLIASPASQPASQPASRPELFQGQHFFCSSVPSLSWENDRFDVSLGTNIGKSREKRRVSHLLELSIIGHDPAVVACSESSCACKSGRINQNPAAFLTREVPAPHQPLLVRCSD
jgi:hypothetical protein